VTAEGPKSWREPLQSSLRPDQAVRLLRGDRRPFALIGEWLSGGAILGSEPLTVAGPDADPFELLDGQPMSAQEMAAPAGAATIGGGWVGWLGYGLGATIERLPPPPPAPVIRPAFALAYYDHVVIHDGEQWWFEALVSAEREQALTQRLELWRSRLLAAPPAPAPPARLTQFALGANGGAGHLAAVSECGERIAAGDLFQANLCVRLEGRIQGDPADLFADAVGEAQPRFGAFFDGVVSLSPERFLRREGRTVSAEPIKGTRPRVGGAGERTRARTELERSTKDAAEHVIIVDLMRNDIGRVCAYGTVTAQSPRVEAHAGVWHLVTTVSGELRPGVGDGQLLRATFPPGSVTGAPKVQAMKVISELEATKRELYTGAIGIASPLAGLDLSVAIRTFEIEGEQIWFGAGGGIVADSDPELELAEALVKAAGPLAAIGGRFAVPPKDELLLASQRFKQTIALEPALRYGERPDPRLGLFDTLLVQDDRPVATAAHLDRLAGSVLEVYGRELDLAELTARVEDAARVCAGVRSRMRLVVSTAGAVEITTIPAGEPITEPARLRAFALPGGLGFRKFVDRRLVEALSAAAPGCIPLFVDTDGEVLEAGHANVWIREGDLLFTPPADGRILAGVTRAAKLAADPTAGEEPIELARLIQADEVFLTSSVAGQRTATLELTPVLS